MFVQRSVSLNISLNQRPFGPLFFVHSSLCNTVLMNVNKTFLTNNIVLVVYDRGMQYFESHRDDFQQQYTITLEDHI